LLGKQLDCQVGGLCPFDRLLEFVDTVEQDKGRRATEDAFCEVLV